MNKKDSVSKFGKKVGLPSESQTCNVHIECSCYSDNYISSEEMDNKIWSCWSCRSHIASVIGKRHSYLIPKNNDPHNCRVFNMVIEKDPADWWKNAGENDDR